MTYACGAGSLRQGFGGPHPHSTVGRRLDESGGCHQRILNYRSSHRHPILTSPPTLKGRRGADVRSQGLSCRTAAGMVREEGHSGAGELAGTRSRALKYTASSKDRLGTYARQGEIARGQSPSNTATAYA